jgi:hypothetical protein
MKYSRLLKVLADLRASRCQATLHNLWTNTLLSKLPASATISFLSAAISSTVPRRITAPSPAEEISRMLWKPMVQYHVHRNRQVAPILNQMSPLHTTTFCFIKASSLLPSHLRPKIRNLSSFFSHYAFIFCPMRATFLTFSILLTIKTFKLVTMIYSCNHDYSARRPPPGSFLNMKFRGQNLPSSGETNSGGPCRKS